jgi:hypothetical protein
MGDTVNQEILWKSVEKISVGLVLCLVCSSLVWLGGRKRNITAQAIQFIPVKQAVEAFWKIGI